MRKKTVRLAAIVFLPTLALSLMLFGCGCGGITVENGKILVGTTTDMIPFESKEGDKYVGFDMDLAGEISERLDLELEIVPTEWNNLIPDLRAGEFDVIMAAMTITYERKKEVDYSDPYFETDQSIVVKTGSAIRSGEGLKDKVVGVLRESTPQYAAEHIKVLKEIKTYDTVTQVYESLENGDVDAMVMDLSLASYRSNQSNETEVVAVIETDEKYGIAIKKGNTELQNEINEAIKEIQDDGTYDRIYKKWFGEGT